MSSYWKVLFWGFGISALGALPLGTLNVAAMQVAVAEGLWKAIWFSAGVALVEVAYVRVSLVAIHWIRMHALLLRWMDWMAFIIVLLLATGSFIAAMHNGEERSLVFKTNIPLFFLGLIMSALNPVQVPFWFGWSTVLFSKKILHPTPGYYNWYTIGIGFGTLAGLAVFVFGGRLLVDVLNAHQSAINYVIGSVFLLTAIIQVVKILRHKGLADNIEIKGAELEQAELLAD